MDSRVALHSQSTRRITTCAKSLVSGNDAQAINPRFPSRAFSNPATVRGELIEPHFHCNRPPTSLVERFQWNRSAGTLYARSATNSLAD